ncbi:propanediol utilization protein PduN [Escherichia coli]|nr:propanediol utilization protein PduN [Escherichia coli]
MHLARVTGAVVSTQKSPSLIGKKTAAGSPGQC